MPYVDSSPLLTPSSFKAATSSLSYHAFDTTAYLNMAAGKLILGFLDPGVFHLNLTGVELPSLPDANSKLRGVHPLFATALWGALRQLSQIILRAANPLSAFDTPGVSSPFIPAEALAQLGLSPPPILAVETLGSQNPLWTPRILTEQYFTVRTLQYAGRAATEWLRDAIHRSTALGDKSRWDWSNALFLFEQHANPLNDLHAAMKRELDVAIPTMPTMDRQVILHPLASSIPSSSPAAADLRLFLRSRPHLGGAPPATGTPPPSPIIYSSDEELVELVDALSLSDSQDAESKVFA
jgi:hypothetical protein